jgi:hypothetical protein
MAEMELKRKKAEKRKAKRRAEHIEQIKMSVL